MYEKYVELRNKKGITDYQVAMETKIPKSTFSEWKSGRSKPKHNKIQALAVYFKVSPSYFYEEEDKAHETKS